MGGSGDSSSVGQVVEKITQRKQENAQMRIFVYFHVPAHSHGLENTQICIFVCFPTVPFDN